MQISYKKVLFTTLQIVLGVFAFSLVAILFANRFGYAKFLYPYVVQSGSMEPTLPVGSVIFSVPQKNYVQGDIITFAPDGDSKKLVTHRIEYKKYPNGINSVPLYITSGDANEDFDLWQVPPEHIVGKVVFSLPYAGYAVDFAKTPRGFILFVIIPATIVIYEELKTMWQEFKKMLAKLSSKEVKEPSNIHKPLSKAYVIAPLLGACIVLIAFTTGYFLDVETIRNNVLGVATSFISPTPTSTPTVTPTLTPTVQATLTPTLTPTLSPIP